MKTNQKIPTKQRKPDFYTRLSSYDYNLPENLIAQTPLEKRDESRLLVFDRKTKE